MKEHWRKEMKQKMADYEKSAPQVSWEQIERSVAEEKRKARIVPLWTRRVAAAAAVMLLAGAGYQAFFGEKTTPEAAVVSEVSSGKIADSAEKDADSSGKVEAQKVSNLKLSGLLQLSQSVVQTVKKSIAEANQIEQENNLMAQNIDSTEEKVESVEENDDFQQDETKTQQPKKVETVPTYQLGNPEIKTVSSNGNRLTAKVYFSNGINNAGGLLFDKSYDKDYSNEITNSYIDKENHYDDQGFMPHEQFNDITHHQPIRFGLAVNYPITERWSIESGFVYTQLSADYNYLTESEGFHKSKQRLIYIGVSLRLNHLLWTNRHFNLYVAGGAMAEKMVNGNRKYSNNNGSETKEKITIRPLQFSVNGAVGAEYRLTDLFSIYAEPEINYYFKNNSIEVPTVYQEKPLNFSLGIGLRLNFNTK